MPNFNADEWEIVKQKLASVAVLENQNFELGGLLRRCGMLALAIHRAGPLTDIQADALDMILRIVQPMKGDMPLDIEEGLLEVLKTINPSRYMPDTEVNHERIDHA